MLRAAFSCMLVVAIFASFAHADVIYLKNGNRIEVEGAEIKDDMVVFTVFQGQMSIALSAVARVEKTSTAPRADAGLVNSIKGAPAFGGTTEDAGNANAEAGGQDAAGGNSNRQELLRAYIDQKQQFERELKSIDGQIQTLRSSIYAKSAIFSDTTEDRAQVQQLEQRKTELEGQLKQLMEEIRKAGFTPGEMRQINSSAAGGQAAKSNVTTIGGQTQDSRDAKTTWIKPDESTDRDSNVVLGEEKDNQNSQPPPQD